MTEYSAEQHYKNFLSRHYSWMFGDFEQQVMNNHNWFTAQYIYPNSNKAAIDFGCGSGFQSLALSSLGFDVTALDINRQLLEELKAHDQESKIDIIQCDISKPEYYSDMGPFELAVCMGDTLPHLPTEKSISDFIHSVYEILQTAGKFILSFRDYSSELTGVDRFIPVQSDDNKIMTVFLEYYSDYILVHDLLYEKKTDGWKLEKSVYKKIRISPDNIINLLKQTNLRIDYLQTNQGFVHIIAKK